jgi:hypothetical protein
LLPGDVLIYRAGFQAVGGLLHKVSRWANVERTRWPALPPNGLGVPGVHLDGTILGLEDMIERVARAERKLNVLKWTYPNHCWVFCEKRHFCYLVFDTLFSFILKLSLNNPDKFTSSIFG